MHLKEEHLTPAWLQQRLAGSELLGSDEVTTVSTKLIGVSQGFMSNVYRISFSTEGGRDLSVVAKISNAVGASMPTMYRAEIDYYRSAASLGRKLARMPVNYACEISESNTEFVLLLEDLHAPYAAGDQVQCTSLADAEAAMDSLAAFHAQWWHTHPSYGSPPPVPIEAASAWQTVARMATIYVTKAVEFVEENGVSVPSSNGLAGASTEEVAALLAKAADVICNAHGLSSSEPLTLVHGDYRPDNIMHAPGLPACPVDYQAVHYGTPTEDLAYYFSGALDVEERRQHEHNLLLRYHRALVGHGVTGYSWERLEDDLLRDRIFATFVPVMLAARLQAEKQTGHDDPRRAALSKAWLIRGCAALADNYRQDVADDLLTRAASLEVPFAEVAEELRGVVAAMSSMPQPNFEELSVEKWRERVQAYVDRAKETGTLHQVAARTDLCPRGVSCTLFSPMDGPERSNEALLWLPSAAVLGDGLLAEGTARAMCNAVKAPLLLVRSRPVPDVPFSALVDDAAAAYAAMAAGEVEGLRDMQIFVCGNQEGGAVAAALLQRLHEDGSPSPAGSVLLSPWLRSSCESRTFTEYGDRYAAVLGPSLCRFKWCQLLHGGQPPYDAVSALEASQAAPKTLAIYAELDVLRADVEDYMAALASSGIATQAHCLKGYVNNFLYTGFPCFTVVASHIRSFLDSCALAQ